MTREMKELLGKINELEDSAAELSEKKDFKGAKEALDEADECKRQYEILADIEDRQKGRAKKSEDGKPDGFVLMCKALSGRLTAEEKTALISGTDATQGENYLIPEDVQLAINELRKTYVSAVPLVTDYETEALTGSFNYESGTPAGLSDFDDGDAITEETQISFTAKTFTIAWKGKLIPISRILLGAERASLMSYLNRWFVKNAVLTENALIFAALKGGYNSGTPKALAGWAAFKSSINKDIDPSCKLNGVIITNQSGFDCLDQELDGIGRPLLQSNPKDATEKLFQGMPIHVFPDAQLANIDSTHFPVIYGDTKAACTFVFHKGLQFAQSEHYAFNKNQTVLRVIEGICAVSTDAGAVVYGKLSATPTT